MDKPLLDSQLLRHFTELGQYLPTGIRETIRKYIVRSEHVPTKETWAKQPSKTVRMKVLREQAIEPWINRLRARAAQQGQLLLRVYELNVAKGAPVLEKQRNYYFLN